MPSKHKKTRRQRRLEKQRATMALLRSKRRRARKCLCCEEPRVRGRRKCLTHLRVDAEAAAARRRGEALGVAMVEYSRKKGDADGEEEGIRGVQEGSVGGVGQATDKSRSAGI